MDADATPTTATEPAPPQRRPRWKRILLPTWQERVQALPAQSWALLVLLYLALAFAWLFPDDLSNPSSVYIASAWVAFAVRTFVFHAGLLALLPLVVGLLRRRWILAGLSLVLTVGACGPELWHGHFRTPPAVSGPTIRVLSNNLLAKNDNTAATAALVRRVEPDIVLFQEYTPDWHAALAAELGTRFPHRAHKLREDSFGQALYTREPPAGRVWTAVPLGNGELPQLRTEILLGGRRVALYNLHVRPPMPGYKWRHHRAALADLLKALSVESMPVIVCGDFNCTNNSTLADKLRAMGYRDVHTLAGRGRGTTWPMRTVLAWLPGVRIDHVYVSRELTATRAEVGPYTGSDHRAIWADIGFRTE